MEFFIVRKTQYRFGQLPRIRCHAIPHFSSALFQVNDLQSRIMYGRAKCNYLVLYIALVIGFGLPLYCGLFTPWGGLYGEHLPLRWQVESFLDGRIALDETPWGMGWDMAWGNGKVHHVFGLAVPVWLMAFELVGRVVGLGAFPDRLCFAIAVGLTTYWILRYESKQQFDLRKVYVMLLTTVLFPPFIALCSSRFLVYEEVVAYGVLTVLALGLGLARFVKLAQESQGASSVLSLRQKSILGLCAIGVAAALVPFVRATLVFYGATTLALAVIVAARRGLKLQGIAPGLAVYCFFTALLLWTNNQRFGAPLEFGHALNLNSLAPMRYASRFDHPYEDEPIWSAVRELVSALFVAKGTAIQSQSGYERDLFPGQSRTFRWREIYFSTFGKFELAFMLATLCIGGARLVRLKFKAFDDPLVVLTLWSVVSSAGLFVFYLRFPFLSSRYLMDFAPALGVCAWVFWSWVMDSATRLSARTLWPTVIVFLCLVAWWGYGVGSIWTTTESRELTLEQVRSQMKRERKGPKGMHLLDGYSSPTQTVGIPFNLDGWLDDGRTVASVAAFVKDPECLALDLAPAGDQPMPISAYECIRAKIGLEFLRRESVVSTTNGVRVVFAGPTKSHYQRGYQLAFIALMSKAELSEGESRFRLLRICWKRDQLLGDAGVVRDKTHSNSVGRGVDP